MPRAHFGYGKEKYDSRVNGVTSHSTLDRYIPGNIICWILDNLLTELSVSIVCMHFEV